MKRNIIFILGLGFFAAIIIVGFISFRTSLSCSEDSAKEVLIKLIKNNHAYYEYNFREGYKIKNGLYTIEGIRTIKKDSKVHLCEALIKLKDKSDFLIPISYEVYETDNEEFYIRLLL